MNATIDKINHYQELRSHWDNSIATLGKNIPSADGHTSIFLYPFNYLFGKHPKIIINDLCKNGWVNCSNEKNGFRNIEKLTDYIQEALFSKNLIFSKNINKQYELWVDGKHKIEFLIANIDVIFFENGIAIFSIFTTCSDTIQNISSILNRELRNPSCLYVDQNYMRFLSFDNLLANIEEIKNDYIDNEKSNFVHMNTFFEQIMDSKNIYISELRSGKSKYAKFITAVHTKVDESLEVDLLYPYPELQHETDVSFNILQMCTNHMATANDFITVSKKFDYDIDYIRANIKNYGVRLWSLWAGLASLNSLAFISVNDGGSSIVKQCKNEIYLIFILDLYVKIRLQHIDKQVIDESFMQQNKARENIESLFILKAKYFSEEVADSFQPVAIDKKIKSALGIDNLLKNIEENIVKTNEIIKENNSSAVAMIAAIYVALNEIIPHFTGSLTIKISLIALSSVIAFLLWKKRNLIGRKIDRILKKLRVI